MSSPMFDNYPQPAGYIPDNRPVIPECHIDKIVIGATAIHTFKLGFLFSQLCNRFQIMYKQSITTKVLIDSSALGAPFEMIEQNGKTLITVTLSSATTKDFVVDKSSFAQIKLYMKDGSVMFGKMEPLIIIPTIED